MPYRSMIPAIMVMLLSLAAGSVHAQQFGENLDVGRIKKCVYEVIVPKPEVDTITYERPLPMDLIPFALRNDKYYSIGTAFASSATEFTTACHVLNLGQKSQFKGIFLRDTDGNVFGLDKIVKYSSRRDFVVFTVKDRKTPEFLEMNSKPELNERVYAVGNALGEGVVIRDGLYTSNTPEEVDGQWNWVRFSAAASPGNSGGPLLDRNGKIIAVVVSKSPNENLNMALPIEEVRKDYGNKAEIYGKVNYQIDIFDVIKTGTLDTTIDLPMEYRAFSEAHRKLVSVFNGKLAGDLMSENRDNIFPNGGSSHKMLYRNTTSDFPQLIVKRDDGNWDVSQPQNAKQSDLEGNGHISHGWLRNTLFLQIEKPETLPLNEFLSDSKAFMDLILKAVNIPRTIGPEKIRITSLGKADFEQVHVDSYGRKWLVKTWPIGYADQEVMVFTLPTPSGCVSLMRIDQTGEILDNHILDLKILTDFVYFSIGGTMKQWREYMAMKDHLLPAFNGTALTTEDDRFEFSSKKVKVSCVPGIVKMSEKTILIVGLGYYRENNAMVWGITRLIILEGKFKRDGFGVARTIKPFDEANARYSDFWQRLKDRQKPYDSKSYTREEATIISTVVGSAEASASPDSCSVLYDVSHIRTGQIDQAEMESGLKSILGNIAVYEN